MLAGIRLLADPNAGFFPVLNMVILWLVVRAAALAFAASVPQLQVSTPPAIEQPVFELPASIDQFNPAVVGRLSVTVTVRASPEPLFVARMTKPI